MRGSLWKFMYLFCVMAGILAGYGVSALISGKENKANIITKDNTLVREAGDSVFFDGEGEKPKQAEVSPVPKPEFLPQEPAVAAVPSITQPPVSASPSPITPTPTLLPLTPSPVVPSVTVIPNVSEDKLPSLGVQWAFSGENVPELQAPSVTPPVQESPAAQAITYPAQIFGQVPVINRSDAYVSYFEFAYDLIAMMEPVVNAKELNMNSLLTKFVIKALFCGVDIEQLDINAPIPRRLAALCLWLAAQVLNESGCDTSSKSAGVYVTDISGCSASEKKAIAYLYESGILKGYQVQGQLFYPEAGLKTETGNNWLDAVKRCWK